MGSKTARTFLGLLAALALGCALQPMEPTAAPEARIVRHLRGAPTPPDRGANRVSLGYFGHLTDLHVVDETAPLRVEVVDPSSVGDYAYVAAWRPQEALSTQAVDDSIRALNARVRSPTPQGDGSYARMSLALVTGDLIDNMQHNEVGWAAALLAGAMVDPYSGRAVTSENPCPDADAAQRAWLSAQVDARAYVGVQRYAQYPPVVADDRLVAFYDPDRAPPPSKRPLFPRYTLPRSPGLLDRAQQGFPATGLEVRYFVTRGNHDSLLQGNYPPYLMETWYQLSKWNLLPEGCRKVYPNDALDPYVKPFVGHKIDFHAIVKELAEMYAKSKTDAVGRFVPPDPNRVLIESPDYPAAFAAAPHAAGFDLVSAEVRKASNGYAHYYAWSPTSRLRFIALDTNAEGGGANGNLDDPQFRWLSAELAALPADTLAVVFAHHALETMGNTTPDECPPEQPLCRDGDPQPSTPIRLGCPAPGGTLDCTAAHSPDGTPNLRDLLLEHPNVVLYVSGHTHENRIEPFDRGNRDGSGFWQITTASVVEWPQETRTIELMDNRDGTLSIFGTIVPGSADLPPPPPSNTSGRNLSRAALTSVARLLAAGDVEWVEGPGRSARGRDLDRDVELLLRDPRFGH